MENTLKEKTISKFFRWQPSSETLVAVIAGIVMIGLSISIGVTKNIPWLSTIIRDIGQIFLGILFPLLYIRKLGNGFAAFGFSFKNWYVFLPINLVLGILLLMLFLSDVPPPDGFRLDTQVLWAGAFIMLAVIFELVFFYGFLRTLFERAFGIIPGVILCAVFYSLHHAGFQPEFGKLFVVGLIFAVIYRIGNSILLLYPFFAGIGATYDVLIQSKVVAPVLYPEIRTLYLAVLILGSVAWIWAKCRPTTA
jgi:membrane protease YdiL (CAAX protease family)